MMSTSQEQRLVLIPHEKNIFLEVLELRYVFTQDTTESLKKIVYITTKQIKNILAFILLSKIGFLKKLTLTKNCPEIFKLRNSFQFY